MRITNLEATDEHAMEDARSVAAAATATSDALTGARPSDRGVRHFWPNFTDEQFNPHLEGTRYRATGRLTM